MPVSTKTQLIFLDMGHQYTSKLAQAQTDQLNGSLSSMKSKGAQITNLPNSEHKHWAEKLPNVPMNGAKAMNKKRLPGKLIVQIFLNAIRMSGVSIETQVHLNSTLTVSII